MADDSPTQREERPYSYLPGGKAGVEAPLERPGEQEQRLRALAPRLAPFARPATLARIAALQLRPENADQIVRLEALAFAAAVACPDEGAAPTRDDLLGWLNDSPLTAFARMEDPCENMPTGEIVFDDDRFVYFAGILDAPVHTLRVFLEACSHFEAKHAEAGRAAHGIMKAALAIGDAVARRLGIERGVEPHASHWKVVVSPDEESLGRTSRAVRFTREEIETLLISKGLQFDDVRPLITATRPAWSAYENESGLFDAPIVSVADEFVVAVPSGLTYAARNAVLEALHANGLLSEFAPILRGVAFRYTLEDLENLGFDLIERVDIPTASTPVLAGRFRFDTDKEAIVIFLHDDLQDFHQKFWDSSGVVGEINAIIPLIEDEILSAEHPPNEILFLFISAGVHRVTVLNFAFDRARAGSRGLGLKASDLAVIAHVDAGDPLRLWSFAVARRSDPDIRDDFSVDVLTEYAFFRSRGRRTLHDGLPLKAFFLIPHELRGELERESSRRQDRHGATYPTGRTVDVRRVYRDGIPNVYVAANAPNPTHHVLVEGFGKPIWVIAAGGTEETRIDTGGLAGTIATWLARAPRAELSDLISGWPLDTVPIIVRPTSEDFVVHVQRDDDSDALVVEIGMGLLTALRAGPRAQDAILHELLDALVTGSGRPVELGKRIATAALHATASPLVVAMPRPRIASQQQLPPARVVQEYATDRLMDMIARWVIAQGLEPGPIEDGDIVPFLDRLHSFLISKLDASVRTLLPVSVDAFVFYYESLADAYAKRKAELPFLEALGKGDEDEQWRRLQAQSQAAVAARFLIEYTAARPPQGLRPPSVGVYDELLALCALIINHRHIRDMHAPGTAVATGEILRSYRPRFRVPSYDEAMAPVHEDSRRMELAGAADFLNMDYTQEPKVPESFPDVDEAFRAEWSVGVIELADFLDAIANLADGPMQVWKEVDLERELVARLGWSIERVHAAVKEFTLGPRDDFLKTPETQPWRFGRREAYVMKPLVRTSREGIPHVTCGPLHVVGVPDFILNSVLNGRFQAKSPRMKRYLAEEQGERVQFNKAVRAKFDGKPGWSGHSSVRIDKAFGGPESLGDVDTLALHASSRTAFIIEVKSFLVARTPYELRNEIQKLFDPEEDGAVPKNEERTNWLNANIDRLKSRYHLEGDWKCVPLVVLDRNLAGAALRPTNMPIIDLAELERRIPTGDLSLPARR